MILNKRFVPNATKWNAYQDKVIIDGMKTNQKNMWVVDRVNVSRDKITFTKLREIEKRAYVLTFAILSKIDSLQGNIGMDILAEHTKDQYLASIFRIEGGMEIVHSMSYNKALSSLITLAEENKAIDEIDNSTEVKDVVDFLIQTMIDVEKNEELSEEEIYCLELAYSTNLESFLFYLLFYYPLYQANVKNRMTACAEIIRLILRKKLA